MFKQKILIALEKASGEKGVEVEYPEKEGFGDYSTNIALKSVGNPRKAAEEIVKKLQKDGELMEFIEKIEIAGPGFINFYLKENTLVRCVLEVGEDYGKNNSLKDKKYLLEHTSPNTIKTLHVGHVRNNILGMSVHNILEFCGADVKLDAINNDRGIHVMKAVWAYMKYGEDKTPQSEGTKPDHFVDEYYLIGSKESSDPKIKEEMQDLLRKWEAEDKDVREVWKRLRDWTFEGFKETYKRLGSHHDKQWFESDFYEHGKEMVSEGLEKEIFKKLEDGAVLTNLGDYGLTDTIVLRSDGTSMYITQDLYLTTLKRKEFPSDLYIWDIGPEQSLYLKQLFAVCEQMGNGKRGDYYHLSYGAVNVRGSGKMSSRAGNVVSADDLIDTVVKKAAKINKEVSESVGLGAIKYGFLKIGRETNIQFDIEESLSLEGNSGPYIQYTFARIQSVLGKKGTVKEEKGSGLNSEEMSIARALTRFPDIVQMSAESYSPNIICNYIYDLASKYNTFYNKHKIIGGENESFKLLLTEKTGIVLKNGLKLLGVEAPQQM